MLEWPALQQHWASRLYRKSSLHTGSRTTEGITLRKTGEEEDLFFGISKFGEVVDGVEYCSLVSDGCIKIVLSPTLVNAYTLKYKPFGEPRFNRANLKYGVDMKRGRPHWCKIFFHSISYDLTSDNNMTISISITVTSIAALFL